MLIAGGGSEAFTLCELVAHTTSGADSDDIDSAYAYLDTIGQIETLPLQITHDFSGPGTITLQCQQNGTISGGADVLWKYASVVAVQASSLSEAAVTS